MYILGEYFSDLAFNKICFWHFIACLNQQREGGIRDLVLLLLHQRKRNTIVNSRTSGKNHPTGYSQVRWEMIWRFALCVVPTSVLLQGDCMILRATPRPVYTRRQSLLLTKPPNMRSDLNNDTLCCLICAKPHQDKACFEFNPSDSVLRAANKAVLTYQSNISSCN
jgi:hypothetical protein